MFQWRNFDLTFPTSAGSSELANSVYVRSFFCPVLHYVLSYWTQHSVAALGRKMHILFLSASLGFSFNSQGFFFLNFINNRNSYIWHISSPVTGASHCTTVVSTGQFIISPVSACDLIL